MTRGWLLGLLCCLAACGRIGFDPLANLDAGTVFDPASCRTDDCSACAADTCCLHEGGGFNCPQAECDCYGVCTDDFGCSVNCLNSGDCYLQCDDGVYCDALCWYSDSCTVDCYNSECRLTMRNDTSTGLLICHDEPAICELTFCDDQVSCGNGIIACKRACPS